MGRRIVPGVTGRGHWYKGDVSWGALPDELGDEVRERLEAYLARLAEARTRFNLIGDPPERWVARHVRDALTLAGAVGEGPLVDVGSGAGLPGLVLAILDPARAVRLVESNRKRAAFLGDCARALGLERVVVDDRRAERVGRDPACRERHAVAVARALSAPPVGAELLLPLVEVGGVAWLQLSADDARAFPGAAAAALGGEVGQPQLYALPGDDEGARALLPLHKRARTPERYPRREGVPARRPLG